MILLSVEDAANCRKQEHIRLKRIHGQICRFENSYGLDSFQVVHLPDYALCANQKVSFLFWQDTAFVT